MSVRIFLLALFYALGCAVAWAAQEAPPPAPPGADIAVAATVLDLGPSLMRRSSANDGYFVVRLSNPSTAPVFRIFEAAENPDTGIVIVPPRTRAALIETDVVAGNGAAERASAFGPNAFRVVLPAGAQATLNLRFLNAGLRPILLAWDEPSLIQHDRQTAILASVILTLIAAAFAFAVGTAVLSGTAYARAAAAFLAALLLAELAAAGVFDTSLIVAWRGPYALFSFAISCALAAGIPLLDRIAPFNALQPGLSVWTNRFAIVILALGAVAFFGVPVIGLVLRGLAVLGTAMGAVYLAQSGRAGNIKARRLAPAATIFALVTAAAAGNALGLFGVNLVASDAISGFSAAGALLVAIATAIPIEGWPERGMVAEPAPVPAPVRVQSNPMQQRDNAAIGASHQGVFDLDLLSGIVSLSPEGAQLIGLPPAAIDLDSVSWLGRIHGEDRGVFNDAMAVCRSEAGVTFRLEFRALGPGDRMAWFELRATVLGDAKEGERCLGLIANVTARKNAELGEEVNAASTDSLTRLGTRAALLSDLDAMQAALKLASLAVFDLDRFKSVNDSLGRDVGDALLAAFADRLVTGLTSDETTGSVKLFRVGGDMFAATAENVADLKAFGERIVGLNTKAFTVMGRDIYLPLSVGIATGATAKDAQALLARAELAMFAAKREGGGTAVIYSEAMEKSRPQDLVAIETDLRRALETNEIELHYQPIVRLKDGAVAGFEALLRWRHPERGLIDPEGFVPQAERSGLILPLGMFALRRATVDLSRWQHFFPSLTPLSVSVNVVWRQIADQGFARDLALLLQTSGIAKGSLHLEITEGQIMAGDDRAEAAFQRLKALGIGLSIDDFGTGHSSFARLARFPFDTIKIDKSFLSAAHDSNGAKILASIIALAHDLKLSVVSEGIESPQETTRLKEMGCEYGQGFLLGSPVPASEINDVISKAQAR